MNAAVESRLNKLRRAHAREIAALRDQLHTVTAERDRLRTELRTASAWRMVVVSSLRRMRGSPQVIAAKLQRLLTGGTSS